MKVGDEILIVKSGNPALNGAKGRLIEIFGDFKQGCSTTWRVRIRDLGENWPIDDGTVLVAEHSMIPADPVEIIRNRLDKRK